MIKNYNYDHFIVMSKSHEEILLQNVITGRQVRVFNAISPSLYGEYMLANEHDTIRVEKHKKVGYKKQIDC
jgi:hypothetical protein